MKTAHDEAEIIKAFNHGSLSSFDYLYWTYHPMVYRNILKLVSLPEQAEEILQDVFVSFWQNRHKIESGKPVSNWLFVVSYNKSMDFLKRKLKDQISYVAEYDDQLCLLTDSISEEEDEIIFEQQSRLLNEAIDRLSPRRREVFVLLSIEGFTKEDVAARLGVSVQSVSDYLKQARKSIRKYVLDKPFTTSSAMVLGIINAIL